MAECQRCPFQQIVDGLTALVRKYVVEPRTYGDPCMVMNAFEYLAYKSKNSKIKKLAASNAETYAALISSLETKLLPIAQKICSTCSMTSDDDNPSNHGMTFVSIDAMAGSPLAMDYSAARSRLANSSDDMNGSESGAADGFSSDDDAFFADMYDETDGIGGTSQMDWINKSRVAMPSPNSDGCTKLPSHIEDELRKVLHTFAKLGVTDQNFVLHQMGGGSLNDFASMRWVPDEMKRRQSKQWASVRWNRIVDQFPIAKVLRKERPLRGVATERSHRYSEEHYEVQELDFGSAFD